MSNGGPGLCVVQSLCVSVHTPPCDLNCFSSWEGDGGGGECVTLCARARAWKSVAAAVAVAASQEAHAPPWLLSRPNRPASIHPAGSRAAAGRPGGVPAPSARVNFSQIPEPLRAKPPPRPNPRPPRICIIGLAAALPPAPAAAAAARDSLAVT